jgi:predicted dehydrogenase
MGISAGKSIEQVVENCDAICILAPSNPEVHERLAQIPLRSGKPIYIDKPFAPDRASAERLFELADKHDTPLMSSSALRFATELLSAKKEIYTEQKVLFAGARGGGKSFEEYGIHQVEMIASLMGLGARRVMQCGNAGTHHLVIAYEDLRRATVTINASLPFAIAVCGEKKSVPLDKLSDFFPNLTSAILQFFSSGVSPINPMETIEIAAIVAAGIDALNTKDQWVHVL